MKYKVVFDTNSIRNAESVADFLGGRSELERFLKVSEIIIPDIVIEEIKNQKRKHLISKRDSFLSNPFHLLRKVDENETKNFDIEKSILELVGIESLPYSTITLTTNVLEDIKKLALGNIPPFDETSDKGFKDAYIYFTVLEYLEKNDGDNVFVVTNDDRLRMSFDNNARVTVVKNFYEFEKHIDTYFREEYFINRLKEEISENITSNCIEEIWLNINENWVIKLLCDDKNYFVEVDFSTREIIGFTDYDCSTFVSELVNTRSFANTHLMVSSLSNYTQYFSNQDIIDLISASTENSQIYSISTDEEVKEFFTSLFESKSQIITDEDVLWRFKQVFIQE